MQIKKIMCNYFEIRAIKVQVRAIVGHSGAINSKTRANVVDYNFYHFKMLEFSLVKPLSIADIIIFPFFFD